MTGLMRDALHAGRYAAAAAIDNSTERGGGERERIGRLERIELAPYEPHEQPGSPETRDRSSDDRQDAVSEDEPSNRRRP